jgi:hypothetical protein
MSKSSIMELCEHIRHRQELHGLAEGLAFHHYHNGKELVPAEYGNRADDIQAKKRAQKKKAERHATAQKKSRKKGKQKDRGTHTEAMAGTTDDPVQPMASEPPPVQLASGNIIPDDLIDPALVELSNQAPDSGSGLVTGGIVIDGYQMEALRQHGYQAVIPINGPNEGPPWYSVPATALDLLQEEPRIDAQPPTPVVEPQPSTKSKVPKKWGRKADEHTIAEAKELIKSTRKGQGQRQLRPR